MKKVFLPLLLIFALVLAKESTGTIDNTKEKNPSFFSFIDKFCFSEGKGSLELTTSWRGSEKFTQDIVVFDDEKSSWHSVYRSHVEKNCSDVIARAKYHYQLRNNETKKIYFEDSASPHWWYFAAVDCSNNELEFDYSLRFLNPGKKYWNSEFSLDDQHLPQIYLAFGILMIILICVHIFSIIRFVRDNKYHAITKLLTVAMFAEFLFNWCAFIHFAVYADNGVGAIGLFVFGQVLDLLAQVVLMLIVLLVAQGWAVSAISLSDQKRLVIILGALFVVYIGMDIWKQAGTNPATHVYMYGTVPGIIILLLRCVVAAYFVYSLYHTISTKHEVYAKVNFYILFGVIFGVWLVLLPILVTFAAAAHSWNRNKIVTGFYTFGNLAILAVLQFMLWPSQAEKFFVVGDPAPLDFEEEEEHHSATSPKVSQANPGQGYGAL